MKIYNSLERKKQVFVPMNEQSVGMYVCGPTVYNRPHIGNARAVVVYDVLFRLLKKRYPKVVYVRNITDVDDKINNAAKENGESIFELSERVTSWFHEDMEALNNLAPTVEPKATEHISDIITLIEKIIVNSHAYESDGHVLFDVESIGTKGKYYYGKLSGKKTDELLAGARVKVESYKRNSGDFVLWKPSSDDESGWNSPWGRGRPGWHIECSAMSAKYLGTDFDIHGGGADLKFPHHENEIAQSVCGNDGSAYARFWVHNGFLTVNGEKMSKSLGNFTTVKELLDKGVKGEVIRYVLLATHYRKPLDFSDKSLDDAKKNLDKFYGALKIAEENIGIDNTNTDIAGSIKLRSENAYKAFMKALEDDMNTPKALAELYVMAKGIRSLNASSELIDDYMEAADLLGILKSSTKDWFSEKLDKLVELDVEKIEQLIEERSIAKSQKNWGEADRLRNVLSDMGITLEDTSKGTTWRN